MTQTDKMIPNEDEVVNIKNSTAAKSKTKVVHRGEKSIYFIERDYGMKLGWISKMNFQREYPLDANYVEIDLVLVRE